MANRRVVHILFSDPGFLPPLLRATRLQAEAGWDIRMVGAQVKGAAPRELPPWLTGRVRLVRGTDLPTWLRFLLFLVMSVATIVRHRPRWLYLSNPLSTPVGAVALLFPGVRLVYHEHDAPAPSSWESGPGRRLVAACRRFVATRAEVCVVPSRGRLRYLPRGESTGQHRLVVNNCPLRSEARAGNERRGRPLRLVFMGSLNPNRLPATVLEALADLAGARLRVIGYETVGHRGFSEAVLERARELRIEERLEMLGFIPWHEIPSMISECDVGLCLLPLDTTDPNERTTVGASNKPYQFLACELPLLVPDAPSWRSAFVERGVARACDPASAESVREALKWFARNRDEAWQMGRRGREVVLEGWNYETEFEPVLDLMGSSHASAERVSSDPPKDARRGDIVT